MTRQQFRTVAIIASFVHVQCALTLAGHTCVQDVSISVTSPANVTYFPQLDEESGRYLNIPEPIIGVEVNEGPISEAIRTDPSSFELCLDWNAEKISESLSAAHDSACRSLTDTSRGLMLESSTYSAFSQGSIVSRVFRAWLRHKSCTDISKGDICLDGNLPNDWVYDMAREVTYSVVAPGGPVVINFDYPAHQTMVNTQQFILPSLSIELTESSLSQSLQISPNDYSLCYEVVPEIELSGISSPSSCPSTCSPIQYNNLERIQIPPSHSDDSCYIFRAWIQRNGRAERLLSAEIEFFSRSAPLKCSSFDTFAKHNLLNRSSIGALKDFYVYPIVRHSGRMRCVAGEQSAVHQRQLLVVAAPRSGTHDILIQLNEAGVKLNHEGVGQDGAVSWLYTHAPGSKGYPINLPTPLTISHCFCFIFHQVRHPLRVISSNSKINVSVGRREGEWLMKADARICGLSFGSAVNDTLLQSCILQPGLLRAARLWLYWNEHAETIADVRYRIEGVNLQLLCKLALLSCDSKLQARSQLNAPLQRSALSLAASWAGIEDLDLELAAKIKAKAMEYGYTLDPSDHPQSSFTRVR